MKIETMIIQLVDRRIKGLHWFTVAALVPW
jgi:hypothetical protein